MPDICQSPSEIAQAVYNTVFRTEFSQPGFALIDLGPNCGSVYTTPIDNFNKTLFQIILINYSMNRIGEGLVGVLHTARIINRNPNLSRIVNSTMIESVPQGFGESVSLEELHDFVTSAVVRRAVYD